MALAAQKNGALAVRIQGVDHLTAVRARVRIPVIGLVKRTYDGFEPYITPTAAEVDAVLGTGAQIVALDATSRPRPQHTELQRLIERIHAAGALAMADCATLADGVRARMLGADITATTLCGYTKETHERDLPALDLVRALRANGGFVICEGGIHSPKDGRGALDAGADAIVVGTAITNVDWLVTSFANALGT